MSLASRVKAKVFSAAWKLGVLDAIQQSTWRRDRLLILCYHGISLLDEHEWGGLYVSPSHFESRLRLLASLGVRTAPLGQALSELAEGRLSEPTVALTFDDGTADFALRAAPLLIKYHVPATVYLTTFYWQRQLPVFDPWASYLLWKGAGQSADLGPLGHVTALPAARDVAARAKLHGRLRATCAELGFTAADKDTVLRVLCASLGISYEEYCARRFMHIMNTEEVRGLPGNLVDIQLHTHRHRSPADQTAFHDELNLNQQGIAEATADMTLRRHFCYPSGLYSEALRENVATYGISSATTCDPGLATRSSDPLLLPRFVDTMSVSDATFAAWVSGGATLLPHRRSFATAS